MRGKIHSLLLMISLIFNLVCIPLMPLRIENQRMRVGALCVIRYFLSLCDI